MAHLFSRTCLQTGGTEKLARGLCVWKNQLLALMLFVTAAAAASGYKWASLADTTSDASWCQRVQA
eukprot:CAMPEP_0171076438 /NCGR_PEP_ID=MMETSP0766_2-20121228/13407_1 /TAXON_ID=439317 /ORGANISM="Gambierdiscus australes, Strain CAWD 149" /LENGTH=65 /DNA_ID=CAMNT_0011533407 /DNA_START=74 /DNA_END=269 /DNA_ORIENTATION=-